MPLAETLTPCRRRALVFAAIALAVLAATWVLHAARAPVGDWVLGLLAGIGASGLFAAVLLWFSPDLSDAVPKRLGDRYRREMLPPMAGYVVSVFAWKRLLGIVDATWLRVLVSLVPALFVLGALRAFVRYVRDSDEMQRRIELEAGAISGLLV